LGAAGLLTFMVDQLTNINFQKIRNYLLIILALIGILSGGLMISDGILQEIQTEDQKLVFDPEINQLLYNYFGENDYQPIFTNYQLRYVPGFEDLQVNIGGFKDYDFYNQKRAENPEVKYMLISLVKYDEKVFIEINSKIETGDYEVIFEHNKYLFVRILNE
jgi:hypothetical protein